MRWSTPHPLPQSVLPQSARDEWPRCHAGRRDPPVPAADHLPSRHSHPEGPSSRHGSPSRKRTIEVATSAPDPPRRGAAPRQTGPRNAPATSVDERAPAPAEEARAGDGARHCMAAHDRLAKSEHRDRYWAPSPVTILRLMRTVRHGLALGRGSQPYPGVCPASREARKERALVGEGSMREDVRDLRASHTYGVHRIFMNMNAPSTVG